jgi:hypothetical protein
MKASTQSEETPPKHDEGLLTAEELLKVIWPNENSRPSLRTLREWQAQRIVPYVKIGRLVFFNPVKVRQSIAKRFTVEAK